MGAFEEIVDRLEGRIDDLADAHVGEMRARNPEWEEAFPGLWDRVRGFTRESLLLELLSLRSGTLPDAPPEVDALGAREIARGGGLDNLLGGYRIAHRLLWEEWLRLVEGSNDSGKQRLLERGGRFLFDYNDRVSALVTGIYERERERILRGSEQRRVQLAQDLLEGNDEAAERLDWPLEGYHVAFVTWGPHSEEAANELAGAVERPLFLHGALRGSWWGWLTGTRPLTAAGWRQLRGVRPTEGVRVAVGDEAAGLEGFRRSHRQAVRAQQLAMAGGDAALVLFEDVALEALAVESDTDAREFVRRELGELGDESPRSERLRETLDAYFGAGHNAAAAAAALGVHQQTVANRLRAIEERLGHPVDARRAELELALRLQRVLG